MVGSKKMGDPKAMGTQKLNHGWEDREFPVYGVGLGYTSVFKTVLDLQQGSQVLDVYRPASVFLLGTPYDKFSIYKDLFTPPNSADPE